MTDTRTLQAARLISNYLGPKAPLNSLAFASLTALRFRLQTDTATYDANHSLFSMQLREAIRTEFFKVPPGKLPSPALCRLVTRIEALIHGFDASNHSCIFPGARVLVPMRGIDVVPGTLLHIRYGVVEGVVTSESFLHLDGINGGSFKWALTPSLCPIQESKQRALRQPTKPSVSKRPLPQAIPTSQPGKSLLPSSQQNNVLPRFATASNQPATPRQHPTAPSKSSKEAVQRTSSAPVKKISKMNMRSPPTRPSTAIATPAPQPTTAPEVLTNSASKAKRALSADPSPPKPVLSPAKALKLTVSSSPHPAVMPERPNILQQQLEKRTFQMDSSKRSFSSPAAKSNTYSALPVTPVTVEPSPTDKSQSPKRGLPSRRAKTVAITALKDTVGQWPESGDSSDTISDTVDQHPVQCEVLKPQQNPVASAQQTNLPIAKPIVLSDRNSVALKFASVLAEYLELRQAPNNPIFASIGALHTRLRARPLVYDNNKALIRTQVREAIRTEFFKIVYPAPPHPALLNLVKTTELMLAQDSCISHTKFFPGTRVLVPTETRSLRIATTLELRSKLQGAKKVSESFLHLDGPEGGTFHWVFTAVLREVVLHNRPVPKPTQYRTTSAKPIRPTPSQPQQEPRKPVCVSTARVEPTRSITISPVGRESRGPVCLSTRRNSNSPRDAQANTTKTDSLSTIRA